MQTTFLVIIVSLLFQTVLFSQTDKHTTKLEKLYEQESFNEIINYKKGKTKKLSTRALYIKGMAYYATEDDKNALKYIDLAIAQGPADENMFFYKGITKYYMGKFKESVDCMDKAISINAEHPDFYAMKGEAFLQLDESDSAIVYFTKSLGYEGSSFRAYGQLTQLYSDKEEYSKALEILDQGLEKLEPEEDYHQLLSYNVGQVHQLAGNHEEAERAFDEHLENYPNDFAAVAKLIQTNYAQKDFDIIRFLKMKLYDAYSSRSLPEPMKDMFCYNQFKWQGKTVFAFELFEPVFLDYAECKYKFLMLDGEDEISLKVQTELDSLSADSSFVFKMVKDDTLYTYSDLRFSREIDYTVSDSIVKQIFSGKLVPTDTMPGYELWMNKLKAQNSRLKGLENDGSSFEKAIFVKSISEEYQWIRKYYPGHTFLMQSLQFHNKKPYDVLQIRTVDGETIDVYFDISDFFGKGF